MTLAVIAQSKAIEEAKKRTKNALEIGLYQKKYKLYATSDPVQK